MVNNVFFPPGNCPFGWNADEVVKPFADEIPLYPDGSGNEGVEAAPDTSENHDLPSDVPADGGSAEEAPGDGVSKGEETSNAADMGHEGDAEVGEGFVAVDGGDADGVED